MYIHKVLGRHLTNFMIYFMPKLEWYNQGPHPANLYFTSRVISPYMMSANDAASVALSPISAFQLSIREEGRSFSPSARRLQDTPSSF